MADVTLVQVTSQRTITIDGPGNERTVLTAGTPTVELTLSTTGLQGAPGPTGPQGPQGVQGPTGPQGPVGTVTEQSVTFASPSTVWDVTHGFPIPFPDVKALDVSNEPIVGDVSYPTPTSVRITWARPEAGTLVITP